MALHILRCERCNSYTMSEKCKCGGEAFSTKPAKYSPDDKHVELKRKAKEAGLREKGLL